LNTRININLPNVNRQSDIQALNNQKYKLLLADREEIKRSRSKLVSDSYKNYQNNTKYRENFVTAKTMVSVDKSRSPEREQGRPYVKMSMMKTI